MLLLFESTPAGGRQTFSQRRGRGMRTGLERLFRPKSIAVVGGGAWCANVIRKCREIGYAGPIWPVHPERREIEGEPAFADISSLPDGPDATFVGVNRHATIDVVAAPLL